MGAQGPKAAGQAPVMDGQEDQQDPARGGAAAWGGGPVARLAASGGPGEHRRLAGVQGLTASGSSALSPPPAPPPGEHRGEGAGAGSPNPESRGARAGGGCCRCLCPGSLRLSAQPPLARGPGLTPLPPPTQGRRKVRSAGCPRLGGKERRALGGPGWGEAAPAWPAGGSRRGFADLSNGAE